ncbi:hypothetical protein Ancab_001286 [Ancistrocladus abbreviatus]
MQFNESVGRCSFRQEENIDHEGIVAEQKQFAAQAGLEELNKQQQAKNVKTPPPFPSSVSACYLFFPQFMGPWLILALWIGSFVRACESWVVQSVALQGPFLSCQLWSKAHRRSRQ